MSNTLEEICTLVRNIRKHEHCSTTVCNRCNFNPGVCLLGELGMSISKGDVEKALKIYHQLEKRVYEK